MDNVEFAGIFTKKFLKLAGETLYELTEDNQAVNRGVACAKLGLLKEVPPDDPTKKRNEHTAANSYNAGIQNMLTMLIKEDVIPGYRSDVGIGGGICRADRQRPSKGSDPADVEAVKNALEQLLPADKVANATREGVAKLAFGEPTAKNCGRVSVAINEGGLSGFTLVTGAKGGIYRDHLVPVKKSKGSTAPVGVPQAAAPASADEGSIDLLDLSAEELTEMEAARIRSEELEAKFPAQ